MALARSVVVDPTIGAVISGCLAMFKIGDQVVHPQYGVGHVVKLEEREFEPGVIHRYYEISIPGSTLWVPLDLPTFGLRKLAARSEIARCRRILASRPSPLAEDSRLRQSDLSVRLKRERSRLTVKWSAIYLPIAHTSRLTGPLALFYAARRMCSARNGLRWKELQ